MMLTFLNLVKTVDETVKISITAYSKFENQLRARPQFVGHFRDLPGVIS